MPMTLQALLLVRNPSGRALLRRVLQGMGMRPEACSLSHQAIERMAKKFYSAVIVDLDLPGADLVLRMARLGPLRKRPVAFAMLGSLTHVESAFQFGANFVLYKPLDRAQVTRSIRAGRGFMVPDRRRAERQPVESLAYLGFAGLPAHPVVLLDVNENGVAVQAPAPLPPSQDVSLRLVLPGSHHSIASTAAVTWADEGGRAGLMFSYMEPVSRRHLKQWLAKRAEQQTSSANSGKSSRRAAAAAAH